MLNEANLQTLEEEKLYTDEVKLLFSSIAWRWFHANLNRKLTTIKLFGIIKKSIYVRDLRDIFTLLFGSPNGLSEGSIS